MKLLCIGKYWGRIERLRLAIFLSHLMIGVVIIMCWVYIVYRLDVVLKNRIVAYSQRFEFEPCQNHGGWCPWKILVVTSASQWYRIVDHNLFSGRHVLQSSVVSFLVVPVQVFHLGIIFIIEKLTEFVNLLKTSVQGDTTH